MLKKINVNARAYLSGQIQRDWVNANVCFEQRANDFLKEANETREHAV